MLVAERVSFHYGPQPVLRDVSLAVSRGTVLGLLGPNGSGKTTLLWLLAGIYRPAEGRVMLDGVDLATLPRRIVAQRIAVVPQETHLAFDYTVLDVALMGRYPHLGPFELERPRDLAIARAALAVTGTAGLDGRRFSTLSGGEKQRVIIASALAQLGGPPGPGDPDSAALRVLLLDEPTSALDVGYQLDVAALVARLSQEAAVAIVLATQDLNFAATVCRDLVLLRDGRIVAAGPTDAVLTPAHIRQVYDVEAEVARHPATGRATVVPLGRTATRRARDELTSRPALAIPRDTRRASDGRP